MCLLAISIVMGCDDVVVQPADVAGVRIVPAEAELAVGSTVQLSAQAVDANNRPVSGVPFTWSSLNTGIATVTSSGLATGQGPGQVQVRATVGEHSGTAMLMVLRPAVVVLNPTAVGFSEPFGADAPQPVSVAVTNGGDMPLTDLTAEVMFGEGPEGWLAVSLAGSAAPTILSVSADPAGLDPGTYHATVSITHSGSADAAQLPVSLELREGTPDAPTNPAATVVSASLVRVTWTDPLNGGAGFEIQRREGAGTFVDVGSTEPGEATFDDDSVVPDRTYGYRVRACGGGGCSAFSVIATATTPPVAPTSLTAATLSTTSIQLSWSDASETATGFEVERRVDGGEFARIATPGGGSTAYTDDGLSPNTAYTYRVRACNSGGCSPFSAHATASTSAIPVPAAPTGLTATAVSAPRVDLAWVDQSANETGFEVQRKEAGGEFEEIATVDANVTTYADTDVTADRVYQYRVRACGEGGCSVFSNEASATTLPIAPTGVSASAVSNTSIDVTWTDASQTETEFRVERRQGSGSFAQVGTAPANATSFSDTGLEPGTEYGYRVRACNDGGCSPYAGDASATTPALPVPASPSELSAAAVEGEAQIELAWVDNSDDETGFRIERRAPGETEFSLLTNVGANVVEYTDTDVNPDGTYVYRVAACAAGGCSAFTGERAATTYPLAPSGLQATARSNSRIDLSWTDNSATETGFRIERRTGGGSFTQVALVGADNTSYSDGGLAPETAYTYRVRACNGGGCSAYTAEATATTSQTPAPAAPSDLIATTVSATRIDLTWTDNSADETAFRVHRSVNEGAFSVRTTLPANTTTFTDEQVAADNLYTYRVEACAGAELCSDYSNEASTVTPPVPPTGLGAAALSTSAIALAWDDNVLTATSFEIQRRVTGGSFTDIAQPGAGSTGYADEGLSPETEYTYRVRSCNAEGCSTYTAGVAATTHLPAPSGLTATAVSATEIGLAWTDNSTTETGFRIERRPGGTGPWSTLTTVGANATSHSDTGLSGGQTYEYRVRACKGADECSEPSNTDSATTDAVPAAPSGLSANATSTSSVSLAWTDNSTTEQEFRLERSVSGGAWQPLITLGPNTVAHVDGGLDAETSYSYRVRACSGGACSNPSNVATTVTHMPAPTGLDATAASPTSIDLAWTNHSTTATGVEIERDGSLLTTVAASATSYTAGGLTPETSYGFRVRAVGSGNASAWSSLASATTPAIPPPAAPSNLSANAVSATEVALTWDFSNGELTGFRLERAIVGDAFDEVASLGPESREYDDSGLAADTEYAYRVRACNGDACSDWAQTTVHTPPE